MVSNDLTKRQMILNIWNSDFVLFRLWFKKNNIKNITLTENNNIWVVTLTDRDYTLSIERPTFTAYR